MAADKQERTLKLARLRAISKLPRPLCFGKKLCWIAGLLLLSGCTSTQPYVKTSLDFLADGTTLKQVVFLKLGQPSATFDHERIVTYRLGFENGYVLLDKTNDWEGAKYSLVLIFDENNVLSKHALVEVR